jgi:hypothetical protein
MALIMMKHSITTLSITIKKYSINTGQNKASLIPLVRLVYRSSAVLLKRALIRLIYMIDVDLSLIRNVYM